MKTESLGNLREDFLNIFQLLTPKQQKIWRLLHWYARNYRLVFPSHERLAQNAGCCRDTVIEALKKFASMGWLGSIKRCFRSSLYFVPDALSSIDLDDPRTFRRPAPKKASIPTKNPTTVPTDNPTLLNVAPSESIERNATKTNENVQATEQKKEQQLPHEVKELPVAAKDKALLARYSLHVLRLAIEDWKTYARLYSVRNVAAFLTSRCKAYLEKFSDPKPVGGLAQNLCGDG